MVKRQPRRALALRSRVRRTAYVFFHLNDGGFLDIASLLRGQVRIAPVRQVFAISILKGEECAISLQDLHLLFQISSDRWTPIRELVRRPGVTLQRLRQFATSGLLVTDEPTRQMRELRRKDAALSNDAWNIYAALYHFMTKWHNVNLGLSSPSQHARGGSAKRGPTDEEIDPEAFLRQLMARHGNPPSHFHTVKRQLAAYDLPLVTRPQDFYRILGKRTTRRAFDSRRPLSIAQLAVILYYVYGCHGYAGIAKDIVGLKKTSPSGGGLHPTEVYPLIINVQKLNPGLYHYNVRDHSLELMRRLTRREALKLADEFTAGQGFPMDAGALFVMTSRFYRNFWKYRMHRKAYSVLLMDVAHLSQTFYLVCAELGVGAFVTAAVNHINIEQKLNLDGFTEGAIAVCGAGVLGSGENDVDPEFLPYVPRKTPSLTTAVALSRAAK